MQTTLTIFAVAMALWLAFLAGAGKAAGLESAAESRAAPVTIVILPPDVKAEDAETRAAAELLCDRLAEGLGDVAGIRVVDRTQIDRVLAEHALARKPAGPVLAYDAMVRVSVDALAPLPRVRLSVIDLSHGNVIGFTEQQWHQEMSPEVLSSLVDACVTGARQAGTSQDGRLAIRVPGTIPVGRFARLKPLAARLQAALEEALGRYPSVSLAHHLEAVTAKEEALLLLVGMSRLPGGRCFAPQADVTIEAALAEIDAVGKTFEETPVEVRFRVEHAGRPGEWATIRGRVGEWDALVAQVLHGVSGRLSGVDPKAGADYLEEMAVRRRQAQAELEKLRSLGAFLFPGNFSTERLQRIADQAATVLKLDPTCKDAEFVGLKFRYWIRKDRIDSSKKNGREVMRPVLEECLHYLRNRPEHDVYREDVVEAAYFAVCWSLSAYHNPSDFPPAREDMERIREIADVALGGPIYIVPRDRWETGRAIRMIYEGMLAAGMSVGPCRRWRDHALETIERKVSEAWREKRMPTITFADTLSSLRLIAATYAVDEGQPERARQLLVDLMETFPQGADLRCTNPSDLVTQARRLNDDDLAKRVAAWSRGRESDEGVLPLAIHWPAHNPPWARNLPAVTPRSLVTDDGSEEAKMVRRGTRILGAAPGRLYLGYRRPYYLPIDRRGRPAAEHLVPLPPTLVPEGSDVLDVATLGESLCLAVRGTGVLVYDPRQDRWRTYGAEEGLPWLAIARIHALEDGMLLCLGGGTHALDAFTLDVRSGEVTLRRQLDNPFSPTFHVWQVGSQWRGLNREGTIEDMLAARPEVRPWPPLEPEGWRWTTPLRLRTIIDGHLSAAALNGRRFVTFPDALREIDDDGRILRTWTVDHLLTVASPPEGCSPWLDRVGYQFVNVPGDVPAGVLLGTDGMRLYFVWRWYLSAYDPSRDMWYGPVAFPPIRRYASPAVFLVGDTIWCGHGGLTYVPANEIIQVARSAGLTGTTEQYRERRRRAMEDAPPLKRAKYALSLRQFDKTKALLATILDEDSRHAEALLLMGLLHDRSFLNQPQMALQYYQRLAAMRDNPSAVLTGLYLQCQWYAAAQNLEKAHAIGREMLTRFRLQDDCRISIQEHVRRLARQIEAASRSAEPQPPEK